MPDHERTMTPFQQALMWAMQDLEECGIDPMTHLETTKALTRLYTSLTEEVGDTLGRGAKMFDQT